MRIAIIDNYDSFTYNLAHLVKAIGVDVDVLRNDCFELHSLAEYDKLLLSPGPGIPSEAGHLLDVIREYAGRLPILGVCLGHQAIAEVSLEQRLRICRMSIMVWLRHVIL